MGELARKKVKFKNVGNALKKTGSVCPAKMYISSIGQNGERLEPLMGLYCYPGSVREISPQSLPTGTIFYQPGSEGKSVTREETTIKCWHGVLAFPYLTFKHFLSVLMLKSVLHLVRGNLCNAIIGKQSVLTEVLTLPHKKSLSYSSPLKHY